MNTILTVAGAIAVAVASIVDGYLIATLASYVFRALRRHSQEMYDFYTLVGLSKGAATE